MHNLVSAALAQAVKVTTKNAEPMYLTLGNKSKVLSTKLAMLSVSFASGAIQMVWCCIVPVLSASVIFQMNWLIQIDPKISWSVKTKKRILNDTNVFLEACSLGRLWDSIG